jgi:hypothetical protein
MRNPVTPAARLKPAFRQLSTAFSGGRFCRRFEKAVERYGA